MLKLLKDTVSPQLGFLEAQKREFVVAITVNSQSTTRVLKQPLCVVHGSRAMNALLTLFCCWALAGREVKGQLTLTRLTPTQHNSLSGRELRDGERAVFASHLAERALLRSLYSQCVPYGFHLLFINDRLK